MASQIETARERLIPETIGRILAGRGMTPEQMAAFLYPDYDRDVYDPYLMTDMATAVERIVAAVERSEQVVVYGDYDIDGITASAVVMEVLEALGIQAKSYIPNRFEEGYGLNLEALERLQAEGAQLVISVDCGITSVAEAAWAREHGLDLIITDHHAVPEVLPEAVAVINPKRPGDAYPCKELAGVGVAFKLAQALQARTGKPAAGQEKWLLDLVALGTVCDVVPLVDENRVLASYGLRVLRRTRRVGLRALAATSGVTLEQIRAYHLGYVLGPRMNAAGRLEHAARSLELVLTGDTSRAMEIAEELEVLNRQRRADQEAIFAAADAMAKQYADDPVLVLAAPEWSHGVVGIVASKLVEKWQRPVLVAQILGDSVKGSARSTPKFNMVEGLREHTALLTKFGGHFFAAGYTLPVARLEEFRRGLIECYGRMELKDEAASAKAQAEIWLEDLAPVSWPLHDELELFEPVGSGNRRPLLELRGLEVARVATIGRDGRHLRLVLKDGQNRRLSAVGFGLAEQFGNLREGSKVKVCGELNKNDFQGSSTLQVVVKDISHE